MIPCTLMGDRCELTLNSTTRGAELGVLSWNINGLTSSKLEDPDFLNYICKYGIIFMYESWTHNKSDINFNGYESFNFYRRFQNRRANLCSGGIVLYLKDSISDGVKVVKNHANSIIWLKLDKNYFKIESDVYIAGVYIWCENSPAYNIVDVDFFSLLQNDINDYCSKGRVILCSDWNAREGNGTRPDYIVCDTLVDSIDEDDYSPDEPLPRRSLDNAFNSHGLKLLDLCKATSLRIANGRLGRDCDIGTYTYASQLGNSVIDYVILNQQDFGCISDFHVKSFNEWSDHAPLSFNIVCNTEIYTCEELQSGDSRIIWNDSLRDEFRRSLIARLTDLNYEVSHIDAWDRNSINSSVENFAEILNDVAKPLFSRQNVCKKSNSSNAFSNRVSKKADWFDDECRAAKQLYFDALNEFNRYKTEDNRLNMCTLKASYKAIVRKKKRKFEYFKIKEIELLRHAKPKDFWKLFKKNKKKQLQNYT